MVAGFFVASRIGANNDAPCRRCYGPVYRPLRGYEDTSVAGRLFRDPLTWRVDGQCDKENGAARASHMGRFETDVLKRNENLRVVNQPPRAAEFQPDTAQG